MNSLLLVGPPNCGKSLLFNRLTGLFQKVANFPGVTVEIAKGQMLGMLNEIELIDFPGTYSLSAITQDEKVAILKLQEYVEKESNLGVVCVLDATRLSQSLLFAFQVLELCNKSKKPLLFALNLIDQTEANRITIDTEILSKTLGAQVVALSAKTEKGLSELKGKLVALKQNPTWFIPETLPQNESDIFLRVSSLLKELHYNPKLIIKSQNKIDRYVLSYFWGAFIFLVTMLFLFQSIFSWAAPIMNWVDKSVIHTAQFVSSLLSPGIVSDFVKDALFSGLGAFLVFVPQIFILSFLIGVLEDSGYLARAAVICHRPLSFFGLSGKSFVSMLSGFACAIPGILTTRNIESPKRRLLTLMIIPLLTCSARLPVYGLLISVLIPKKTFLGGLVGYQGFVFFLLYLFGLIAALIVAGLSSATVAEKIEDSPFILEMPAYRLPHFKLILKQAFLKSISFVKNAGWMIFCVTLVVWFLGYFPDNGHLENSYLAWAGKFISPIFEPLGLNWKYGVAILTSFLAREVFVGTLGTLYGIENAVDDVRALNERLVSSHLSLASGVSLLVFYALALQCFSTLAVIRKETGSWKIPLILFLTYGLIAYLFASLTYWLLN